MRPFFALCLALAGVLPAAAANALVSLRLQLHQDEVPDRARARPRRLRRAVRRLRATGSASPTRSRDGGATVFVTDGEPAQLDRGARRAADRPDRDDRRHHRQAEGEPDRPQPRRPRRALRRRGAARSGRVGDARSAAPHKGAELADYLRANVQNGSFTEAVLAYFANSLGTVLGLLDRPHQPAGRDRGARLAHQPPALATFNAHYPQGVPTTACGSGAATRERHPLLLVGRHRRADQRARRLRRRPRRSPRSSTPRRTTAWSAAAARTSAR